LNGGYEIPPFGGKWNNNGLGKRVFGGWEIAGLMIRQTGTPFTVSDSTGAAYYGVTGSTASWATGATWATAQLSGTPQSRLTQYFNTAAFVKAGNYFGDASRNGMRGPSQRNFDLALIKDIRITERVRTEFRGEAFNAFNMVNFANPSGSITSSNFGKITATTGSPRVLQFALKLMF
jgi:hypothetical protein